MSLQMCPQRSQLSKKHYDLDKYKNYSNMLLFEFIFYIL